MWFWKKKKEVVPAPLELSNQDALHQIRKIREMMWDTSARFSMSQTLDSIAKLEKNLNEGEFADEVRAEIAYSHGYLAQKQFDQPKAIEAYGQALAYHEIKPFLPEKPYLSARMGVALSLGDLGKWQEAISAMQAVLPVLQQSEHYNEDQVGGCKERLAFWLHEAGDFEQAKVLNLEVIAACEAVFGTDAIQLTTSLTNLAQNHHALSELDQARSNLDRALSIAQLHGEADKVQDLHFQLGVVSFEQGSTEDAETHFKEGLAFAKTTQDQWLIDRAQQQLDEFYARRDKD